MVKFYEREDHFKYSWEQVAQAFWSRYPNPYSSHVLSEDVVFRYVEGSLLHSKRLLTKTNRLPKWGEKIMNARHVCIIEESTVDAANKTITTYTRNIGLKSIMTVEERCVYRSNPDENNSTLVDRQAWISSGLFGFATAIQAFGMDRFRKNVAKTCQGFNYTLESMFPVFQAQTVTNQDSAAPLLDREKLRERAKKATELAKSKASPFIAARNNNPQ